MSYAACLSVDEFASELPTCLSVDEFATEMPNCLSVDEVADALCSTDRQTRVEFNLRKFPAKTRFDRLYMSSALPLTLIVCLLSAVRACWWCALEY
jgi:hypothetical protein